MIANFELIEPGCWAWGEYEIEINDYDADCPFTLYLSGKYLWDCETFEAAVMLAEKEKAGD